MNIIFGVSSDCQGDWQVRQQGRGRYGGHRAGCQPFPSRAPGAACGARHAVVARGSPAVSKGVGLEIAGIPLPRGPRPAAPRARRPSRADDSGRYGTGRARLHDIRCGPSAGYDYILVPAERSTLAARPREVARAGTASVSVIRDVGRTPVRRETNGAGLRSTIVLRRDAVGVAILSLLRARGLRAGPSAALHGAWPGRRRV